MCDEEVHTLFLAGKVTIAEIMNETHWSNPAVQNVMGRYPLHEVRLGNHHVPAGALLVLGLAAANADPEVHVDDSGHTFTNESHLAFGSGPHECPTAAQRLAKIIGQTAVERFLARCRTPRLRDDGAVQHGGSVIVRQLTKLAVIFTADTRTAVRHTASGTDALGESSRSSHYLFPPRMLTQLTSHITD
ncbi:hypothetical protein ACH49_23300 [Streptomyces leeuwenhoekii]|uniref:Cytochrome P450 n=1 Tax=Streptomyces leeuwenhoekii TaxID=1437453 RepID=A0ABR5HTP4_STRLW|nr:hypothetical protein ACH49_23300 [Streptomyces leeuwenhoekii]